MKVEEVIQQPGSKEMLLKEDIMKSLHVAIPGEIEAYYPATRTAIIQPVIRGWKCKDNPPLLIDVPVYMWGNFTFTPQKGDGCLVVCADACVDSWIQSGGVSTPVMSRTHSLSDGFAFVGFRQTGGTDLPVTLKKLRDDIDAATRSLAGKKDKRTAVPSPTASGTDISFIDSISQNENGDMTPTKKTVRNASKTQSGVVNTGEQSFSGVKSFDSPIIIDRRDANALLPGRKFYLLRARWKSADGVTEYSTYPMSAIATDQSNGYNAGILMGSLNGMTVITAGESGENFCYVNNLYDHERIYLVADDFIAFYPGVANDGTPQGYYKMPAIDTGKVADLSKAVKSVSQNKNSVTVTKMDDTTDTFTGAWRGYQVKTYSFRYTIAAGAMKELTGTDFGILTPSGYTPVAVKRWQSGYGTEVFVTEIRAGATGSDWVMRVYNKSSQSLEATAGIEILYLQTN